MILDDNDGRRNYELLDVLEDLDAASILERGIQDYDIRFPIQNHRGRFFKVRRFSHHTHADDSLKALLESVAKMGICVCQDNSHTVVLPENRLPQAMCGVEARSIGRAISECVRTGREIRPRIDRHG